MSETPFTDFIQGMAEAGAPVPAIILAVRALEMGQMGQTRGTTSEEVEVRRTKERERKRLQRLRKMGQNGTVPRDKSLIVPPRSPEPSKIGSPTLTQLSFEEVKEGEVITREGLFDEFWKAYPRREGNNPRKPALLRFNAVVAKGAVPRDIIEGAGRYTAKMNETGKFGTQYVQRADVWLNQEGWKNDYSATSGIGRQSALEQSVEHIRRKFSQGRDNSGEHGDNWPTDGAASG